MSDEIRSTTACHFYLCVQGVHAAHSLPKRFGSLGKNLMQWAGAVTETSRMFPTHVRNSTLATQCHLRATYEVQTPVPRHCPGYKCCMRWGRAAGHLP